MTVWIESPFDSLPTEGYRKQRYWMMAEAFVRAGHRVVYWTSDFSHARKERRSRETKTNGGFEIRFVPTLPYEKNVSWARVRSHRAYAKEWERAALAFVAQSDNRTTGQSNAVPDLIIASAPPVSTGQVGLRLARRFGARFVVDVQDAWPETFYRLLPRGFQWIARLLLSGVRRAMGRVYRQASLVTGVCDRYAELVKGHGARDYYRAYLGFQEEGFRFRVSGDRGQGTGDGVMLAYVGNLGRSYDLKTVVEGVRLLRRNGVAATLDVAGFGGTVEEGEFVRFHGMLREEELRKLLEQCDLGVIPMTADSFVGIPNKLAEYAAAGLRIVSSLEGETAELLTRYGCGVGYRAGNAVSFAAAVREAMRIPADAGRRLVENEFAAERIYDAYCKRVFCAGLTGVKV